MKLKIGDIFTISINEKEIGFGQIISLPNKNSLIIAIFDLKQEKLEKENFHYICSKPILLVGDTLDAKLFHKHWIILGNYQDNIKSILLPYFRLGSPPKDIFIVDYSGNIIRPATIVEFNKLEYLTVVAPIRFENALKAHFKEGEWKDEYDKLSYKNAEEANKFVTGNHGLN